MTWSPGTSLPAGMTTAAAVMLGLYGLFRVTNRGKASPARLSRGVHVVQAPFLLPLSVMAFDGLAGNIIGFIVAPAMALWLPVSVPGAIALFVGWTLGSRRAFQKAQVAGGSVP